MNINKIESYIFKKIGGNAINYVFTFTYQNESLKNKEKVITFVKKVKVLKKEIHDILQNAKSYFLEIYYSPKIMNCR